MTNPYIKYYINQAGSGLSVYQGSRNQKGHGFFRSAFNFIKPGLKYLGKQLLGTTLDISDDFLNKGEDIRGSIKKRLKSSVKKIGRDILNKGSEYLQEGSGQMVIKRRYKRRKLFKPNIKIKKNIKRKSRKRRVRKNKIKIKRNKTKKPRKKKKSRKRSRKNKKDKSFDFLK